MEYLSEAMLDACEVVEPAPKERAIVGHSYAFLLDPVRAAAAANLLHLDTWLLHTVAALFYRHRPASPCILFFSLGNSYRGEFVRLTLSERTLRFDGAWLSDLPGFLEYGRERLTHNASLWGGWDGRNFFRIHDFLDLTPSGLMVVDIGGLRTITISCDVALDDYERIRRNPLDNWDYSAIPTDCVDYIETARGKAAIHHLAYQSLEETTSDAQENQESTTTGSAPETVDYTKSKQHLLDSLAIAEDRLREIEGNQNDLAAAAELNQRIGCREFRCAAIVEACERNATRCIPAIVDGIDKLTWDEVGPVINALPRLAPNIVEPLIKLLSSSRKQTIEVAASALARIGDPRACRPLLEVMVLQSGKANAIRARNALIEIGSASVPTLLRALEFEEWETRMYSAEALGAIGDESAIEALKRIAANDRSAKVRAAANEAIAAIRTETQP